MNIEMSRRFVHEEKIGRIDQKFNQIEPALFSSAEHSCFFIDVILTKKKRTEDTASFILTDQWSTVQQLIEHRFRSIQRIGTMLAEITDLRVMSQFPFPFLEINDPRKNF